MNDAIVKLYLKIANEECEGKEWCCTGVTGPVEAFYRAAEQRGFNRGIEAAAKKVDHIYRAGGGTYGEVIRALEMKP